MNLLKVAKKGIMRGSVLSKSKMFQSKVGHGFRPSPFSKPTMLLRFMLLGAIHDSQEKMDKAWKMKSGNQK